MHEKIYNHLEHDGKEQNRMGFLITFYGLTPQSLVRGDNLTTIFG